MLGITLFQHIDHGNGRYKYLTVQAEILMEIYMIISVVYFFLGHDETKPITKLKGLIMQITLSIHFLVMIFYWLFVARDDWRRIQLMATRKRRIQEFACSLGQHMLFCLIAWFNLLTSRTTFSPGNFKYLLAYAIGYGALNWYCSVYGDRPVYPVIDWKSASSAVFLIIAFSLSFLGFWISLKISQAMNRVFGFGHHPVSFHSAPSKTSANTATSYKGSIELAQIQPSQQSSSPDESVAHNNSKKQGSKKKHK